MNNRAKDGIKTDKKEIITFTVYKLVAENGLGNIPVSLISKESGVAVGTIYFYFGSKRGLMDSIYSDIMTEISRYIALGIESAKTVEEKIYCFWMGYYSYCINNPLQANFICQPGIEKYISPKSLTPIRYFQPNGKHCGGGNQKRNNRRFALQCHSFLSVRTRQIHSKLLPIRTVGHRRRNEQPNFRCFLERH